MALNDLRDAERREERRPPQRAKSRLLARRTRLNISFLGGEVTCGAAPYHPFLIDGGAPDFVPPRKILFDGVYFHDWHTAGSGAAHRMPADPVGRTVLPSATPSSGIARQPTAAVARPGICRSRGSAGDPKTRNVLVENNFFYGSGNRYAINSGDWINLAFRYNSIAAPIIILTGWGDGTPVELVGNVMGFSGCQGATNRWRQVFGASLPLQRSRGRLVPPDRPECSCWIHRPVARTCGSGRRRPP